MPDHLSALPVPLLEWYRDHARVLPWRSDPTPYHVWLSEIMLQQTRVAAVLGYYERFLQEAPDIPSLAALPEERLMKLWQGLGYYNRARSLQKAAAEIVRRWNGVFPQNYEDVLSLPGIGEYTAGAICSIAFGQNVPAIDGNLLRVLSRLRADPADITLPQTKKQQADLLREILPVGMAGQFNQAMMDLGATVCLPNGAPKCEACPVSRLCRAHAEGRETDYPVKTPKKARVCENRTVYLIFSDRRVALRRRPEHGLLAGLWEYPNEKDAPPVPPDEWHLRIDRLEDAGTGKHIFTHREWHMKAVKVFLTDDTLPDGWVWAGRGELERDYAVPGAFAPFAGKTEEEL